MGMSQFFARRGRRSLDAATGGVDDAYGFILSPAPVLLETIASIRALYGEQTPAPRVTGDRRPAVTVSTSGLTISERRAGILVTVPAADIMAVTPGTSKVTFAAPKYPSVLVTIRHSGSEIVLALPPLLGGTQTVSAAKAQQLASEVPRELGLRAPQASVRRSGRSTLRLPSRAARRAGRAPRRRQTRMRAMATRRERPISRRQRSIERG